MLLMNLETWNVNSYYPYEPILDKSMETGDLFSGSLKEIDAKVPGSLYIDLEKAGILEDPFYGMNSLKCEWVKDRWWLYRTTFVIPEDMYGRHIRLRFDGINYKGSVTLNGEHVACHQGAFTPFQIDITDKVKYGEMNSLVVTIENAPDVMGQIGMTEQVCHYTPRFHYKWDFAPRMVDIGLCAPVRLEQYGIGAIEYSHIQPELLSDGTCIIHCQTDVTAFHSGKATIRYTVSYDGCQENFKEIVCQLSEGVNSISADLKIENPKLWWPNGYGEQELYKVEVLVSDKDGLSDQASYTTGIRTLEYCTCDDAPEGSLPYSVVINGKRIYIKGVNMVPLDIRTGTVSTSQVEHILRLAKDANVNLLRLWGGGVIESEYFYEMCDTFGLMVFQEFIQSSSGLNNVPSKDPSFIKEMKLSAENTVKVKRNHVSLTFWSGGNELRKADDSPADMQDENLKILAQIVARYDSKRQFLPTSASGPKEYRHEGCIDSHQFHDVHGPWKYDIDNNFYYKIYNDTTCQLHSEFGVDGVANIETLKRILPEKDYKHFSTQESIAWRHHGAWWNTMYRDSQLFGKFENESLEQFVKCSQFVQYEGIRYALNANRQVKYINCGSIVWQFNEPWPNSSCTNLVDYYGLPKLGYYALREAYRPVAPSVRYDKLIWRPGETAVIEQYVCNDQDAFAGELEVAVHAGDGSQVLIAKFSVAVEADSSAKVGEVSFVVQDNEWYTITQKLLCGNMFVSSEYWVFSHTGEQTINKQVICSLYDKIRNG